MAKCSNPTQYGDCRKCPECKDRRLRSWVLRMILESMCYEQDQTTFVTLTYAPENLPRDAEAAKRTLQLFFKRLRKCFPPESIRYAFALEEGKKATMRYHWHGILFGPRFTQINRQYIRDTWKNGFIDLKPGSPGRMAYVMKYVCKDDGQFMMSRKPGLGSSMIPALEQMIAGLSTAEAAKLRGTDALFRPDEKQTVSRLNVGGYDFPLHRYLKDRLTRPKLEVDHEFAREIHFRMKEIEEEKSGTSQKIKVVYE